LFLTLTLSLKSPELLKNSDEKRGMFEPKASYRAITIFLIAQVPRRATKLGVLSFGYIFFSHKRKVTRQQAKPVQSATPA
jgi:hypothetical protein